MARATVPAAFALLVLVPFSGCFGADGKDFGVIEAPRWAAGHTWTYALTSSMSTLEDSEDDMPRGEATRMDLTVFNTTEPMAGAPVYYATAQLEGEKGYLDTPFFEGEILAYAQDTLRVVGRGHTYPDYMVAYPAVHTVEGKYPEARPESPDPCDGRPHIDPVEDGGSIPLTGFPLKAGTQRGTWSPDGEEDVGFDYVMDVEGLSSVETEAGEFEAVHIAVAMTPSIGDGPEGFGAFRIRGDYWYAPSVEQFVLMELGATASGGFAGDGTFHYESRAELVYFELAETAETAAPIYAEPMDVEYRAFQIVSDVALPQNAAEGPVTARFALKELAPDEYRTLDVETAESFPPPLAYDPEKYTVFWLLQSTGPGDYEAAESGDVFEHTFPAAGSHWLEAQLRPLVCGLPWLGSSSASVHNYWEKTWTVQVDPGPARAVPVDTFPIESFPSSTRLEWSMDGTGLDGGHVALIDPTGSERRGSEGTNVNSLFLSGEWQLVWQAYGREVGGGLVTPVVGDDVTVTLRIDYGQGSPSVFHLR